MSAGSEPDRSDATANVETSLRSWRDRPIVFGIAALLTLFGLPCVVWLFSQYAGNPNGAVVNGEHKGEAHQQLPDGNQISSEESVSTRVADAYAYAEDLVAPDSPDFNRFKAHVRQLVSDWENLRDEATAWHDQHSNLRSGEEGRKLAASSELVKEFLKSEDWERPSLEEVQRLKGRLDGFASMLEEAEKPMVVGEDPGEEVFEELTALDTDVSNARDRLGEIREHVTALQQRAAELPPATESLEEAMKRVRERAMERQADDILAKRQERIDEQNDKLLALEIEEVGRRTGGELARAREETARLEAEKRRVEEEAKEAARKREEALFWADLDGRFEREYPAMEKYLTAFTSEGYTQMIAGEFRPIAIKRPVSYQRLVDAGLLNAGEESFRAFWGALDSGTNDRELGAFPAHSFSSGHRERHYETVVEVREFLREFGPLMAKKKRDCLSP